MYNVNSSVVIKAPADIVYSTMLDMNNYSSFMHYVKSVKVHYNRGEEKISEWHIDVEGADVNWEERDVYNEQKKEMIFSMIRGDYNLYYGRWAISSMNGHSILSIDLNVDWGIPSFEKVLEPVLVQKSKKIVRGMLAAFKLQAQSLHSLRVQS